MRHRLVLALLMGCAGLGGCGDGGGKSSPKAPEPDPLLLSLRDNPRVAEALPADARAVLEAPDGMRIYAVDEEAFRSAGKPDDDAQTPLTHALSMLRAPDGVKATTQLADLGECTRISGLVYQGLAEPAPPADCYNPRHAIIAGKGKETIVLVICFECNYIAVLTAATSARDLVSFHSPALKQLLGAKLDPIIRAANR